MKFLPLQTDELGIGLVPQALVPVHGHLLVCGQCGQLGLLRLNGGGCLRTVWRVNHLREIEAGGIFMGRAAVAGNSRLTFYDLADGRRLREVGYPGQAGERVLAVLEHGMPAVCGLLTDRGRLLWFSAGLDFTGHELLDPDEGWGGRIGPAAFSGESVLWCRRSGPRGVFMKGLNDGEVIGPVLGELLNSPVAIHGLEGGEVALLEETGRLLRLGGEPLGVQGTLVGLDPFARPVTTPVDFVLSGESQQELVLLDATGYLAVAVPEGGEVS